MSDFKFNCPHCHQRLGVPESALGQKIPCPLCKGHIRLPATWPTEPDAPRPAGGLRVIDSVVEKQPDDIKFSCPKCAVHIVIAERAAGKQITCRRCGSSILVPAAAQPAPVVAPPPAAQPVPANAPGSVADRPISVLIAELRGGNVQAGRELVTLGETMIPILVEGLQEKALEEPNTNRGADHVCDLLVKCGGASVQPLIAKLGKSRHAYLALGRIGNEKAVQALGAELSSVNWRRVELACQALSLTENPGVQKYLPQLSALLKSTRSGEVFSAAAAALAAIQKRYPKGMELKATPLPARPARGAAGMAAATAGSTLQPL